MVNGGEARFSASCIGAATARCRLQEGVGGDGDMLIGGVNLDGWLCSIGSPHGLRPQLSLGRRLGSNMPSWPWCPP